MGRAELDRMAVVAGPGYVPRQELVGRAELDRMAVVAGPVAVLVVVVVVVVVAGDNEPEE